MIQHPYVVGGDFHSEAHAAAMDRAFYYGTAGLMDPRAYTLEPWLLRKAGMSWSAALRASAVMAIWTVPFAATFGYLGFDPLNVTPGYGLTLDPDTTRDRFGDPVDFGDFDFSHFLM